MRPGLSPRKYVVHVIRHVASIDASMRPGLSPRKYSRRRDHGPNGREGFNEAGAFTPEIQVLSELGDAVVVGASMRPGLSPRKYLHRKRRGYAS